MKEEDRLILASSNKRRRQNSIYKESVLKDTAGCPDLAVLPGRYYELFAHSNIAKGGVFKIRSLEEDTDSASVIIRPNERVVPGRIYWHGI